VFGKFSLKTSNFAIFFPFGQKNLICLGQKVPGSKAGRPLIYCGSKVSSGRVRSGPISKPYPQSKQSRVKKFFCIVWSQSCQPKLSNIQIQILITVITETIVLGKSRSQLFCTNPKSTLVFEFLPSCHNH